MICIGMNHNRSLGYPLWQISCALAETMENLSFAQHMQTMLRFRHYASRLKDCYNYRQI
jgi:hypothetical protein